MMFDTPDWDEDAKPAGDDAKVAVVPGFSDSPSKKKKKKKTKKKDKLINAVNKKLDRAANTPSLTEGLINKEEEEDVSQKGKKKKSKSESDLTSLQSRISEAKDHIKRQLSNSSVTEKAGEILRKGIKFASPDEFEAFKNAKSKKKKKRKRDEDGDDEERMSPSKKALKDESGKKVPFDVEKLKDAFQKKEEEEEVSGSPVSKAQMTLTSSRFRYISEKLYTQTGSQSLKMFKEDPESFKVYHEGYVAQARKWPVDPLNLVISALLKRSDDPVVADFGCGEAKLARSLTNSKVHSFDLVALNDRVTVCDMSKTPLKSDSIDVAVFCLSLMGLNLRDYLKEANRVLKKGGILKIAEVESRFADTPVSEFISIVEKYGFKLKWKDLSHGFFYLMDFTKTGPPKKKVPDFSLKPCIYKKR